MNGAAGVETVGVGRNAAHGVHGDRATDHVVVLAAPCVSPRDIKHDLFFKRHMSQLSGDALDLLGLEACFLSHVFRCIFIREITLGHDLEGRHNLTLVDRVLTGKGR